MLTRRALATTTIATLPLAFCIRGNPQPATPPATPLPLANPADHPADFQPTSAAISQPPTLSGGFAPINGARLYFEAHGSGEPIVFVHAALLDHRMWQPQLTAFAAHHRVIAYDARGYGRSTLPSVPYSNASDLRDLLRYLGAPAATIVGCSLGASIALDLAIESPESVAALVLVNGVLNGHVTSPDPYARDWSAAYAGALSGGPTQPLAESFRRTFVDGQGTAPESVHAAIDVILADYTFAHFARGAPAPLTRSHLAGIASVSAPTLVVVGERDIPTIHEFAYALATRLPNVRKLVLKSAAHFPNLEQPETFTRELLWFLSTLA